MTETVPSQPIRVFLLTENRLLREALVRVFHKRSDFLVVGQSGETALTLCDILDSKCNVLVIASFNEYWLPASFTLDKVGQLGFKVVMIGMDSNEEQFLATVRAGVTGYLLKDASASDVVSAVRAVSRGEAVCPPQLCQTLFRFVARAAREIPGETPASKPELTLRQQQLVSLVAKGLTNKEIASRLNLSEYTVRNHIHRILKQVDAESRSEAVDVIRASGFVLNA
jgi:DNA-binding NarL/FixJ family response regulator